jgi:hypothetical protein
MDLLDQLWEFLLLTDPSILTENHGDILCTGSISNDSELSLLVELRQGIDSIAK